jgi:hypothetical protein
VWIVAHFCDLALNQFAGFCTGGIQGVEMAQHPTQFGFSLQQRHCKAPAGQISGCRHARYAPADDCRRRLDCQFDLLQRLQEGCLGHSHANEILGLLGRPLAFVHVHPGALIPDVDKFEQIAVEPTFLASCLK